MITGNSELVYKITINKNSTVMGIEVCEEKKKKKEPEQKTMGVLIFFMYQQFQCLFINKQVLFFSCRPYWRCYYSNTDAIIYVVDSCDRDRIGISKSELVAMLEVRTMG